MSRDSKDHASQETLRFQDDQGLLEERAGQTEREPQELRGIEAERPEMQPSVGEQGILEWPMVEAFGETAVKITFGEAISPMLQQEVRRFMLRIEQRPLPGMVEAVPSFAAVVLFYDLLNTGRALVDSVETGGSLINAAAVDWVRCLLEMDIKEAEQESDRLEIPVCYGSEHGPDLDYVAAQAGLTPEEVISIHAGRDYPVYMIGFAPGFPYLGGMDERVAAPRLNTPRLSVPAGSVGIAGGQTGVYPVSTPGGWRLIGRTPLALFRPDRTPPSLLRAGDTVRFRPVTAEEYVRLEQIERVEPHGRAARGEAASTGKPKDSEAQTSGIEMSAAGSIDSEQQEPAVGLASSARGDEGEAAVHPAGSEEEEISLDAEAALQGRGETRHPVLTVRKPGLLTTIQDLGRPGYQQYGVTAGGAMDAYALRAANLMVGNAEGEAALEITLAGPTLRFERETLIALAGADLAPSIGGEPLPMWRPVRVRAGAVLEFRTALNGCRAYLALAGGFGVPEALGSRSTDLRAGLGGLEGRALRAGDVLHMRTSAGASGALGPLRAIAPGADFAAATVYAAHGYTVGRPDWADVPAGGFATPAAAASSGGGSGSAAVSGRMQAPGAADPGAACPPIRSQHQRPAARADAPDSPPSSVPIAVRFTRGTHFDHLDEPSRRALLDAAFRVEPQSDRMGCRLAGPALRLSRPLEMISEAAAPGTVQLPPSGDPIVLAADRQTTGGYPRIAQVAAVDLRVLAQLRPGQKLRFIEITLEEAERLYIERERELERLRIAWRLWRKG